MPPGMEPPLLEHCPGYTARLPEVRETLRNHTHWDGKGTLSARYDGETPGRLVVEGLEVLQRETWAVQAFEARSRSGT